MSFHFKANILYCRQPQRMLRLLVDLFEASYVLKKDHFIVDLDGARFLLKELPKKEQLEIAKELNRQSSPLNSFCLTTNDRQLLSEIEERFQFFLFKEVSDLNPRERISRIRGNDKEFSNEGIILFDDDGRSWSVMYEDQRSDDIIVNVNAPTSELYDHYLQKLNSEDY